MVTVETNMGESCNEYHDILTSDEEKSLHDLNQCKSTTLVKNGMSKDQILSKEFSSHEKAHEFYMEYAKNMGFGSSTLATRRSITYGYFIDAKFACTKYGKKRPSTAENPRPCLKCDCKALLHVKRRADGIWYVRDFIEEHNHDLIPDFSLHFPCHRSLSTADKITIDHLHSLSIPPSKIHATLTSNYGGVENVNCDEKDIRNYIDKQRCITMQFGDTNLMLELFASLQEEDPNFFYAIDLDENERLKSVFWVHGKGREDYKLFKDVVVFDTTYITNKYKMPFAPFVGVNNHFQTTLLGCALLTDESTETFVWLMKTWLRAMNGEAPNAILTDQCKAMKPAILKVFPNARHRFCLWHIMRKIPEKLSHVIKEHEQFIGVFKGCIYRTWTEMDFEKNWKNMIDKFERL